MKKLLIFSIGLSILWFALPASAAFYLHGTGPNENPPTLFLDNSSPTAGTAKYRDSAGIKFSGGNLWKEIGTWQVTTSGRLTELNNLHVWLGLKNSDDIGTRFDLRAEVYRNGQSLITLGELYCIQNITRNPDLAKEVVVSFGSFSPVDFNTGDLISLKILTRIGTNGDGTFCGGHSNAVGLRLYFDAVSRPSRFDATISENSPPVADAGQDRQVRVGDLVTLDGRNSYDPDGDLVTYNWTVTEAPSGSSAFLNNPTSVTPTFVPDIPGDYIILLTVNDGKVDSSPDDVVVIAAQPNVAPTANAGPDQSVVTGTAVVLDGRWSFDPDGDPLTYQWQIISLPVESTVHLDDPTSPTPSFLADKAGQYVILLTVNDGWLGSLPDDVVVISATPNAPPIAYAGDDQTVYQNTIISLNASGSYDPDNDPLTYNWSIVSRPEGSTSELDDPTSPTPKIFADRVGEYVFRLVVYDGELYSNPDTVIITSIIPNQNPIANPGGPYAGFIGVPVHFNGSGSYDPDGDPITFNWDFGDGASGSGVTPVHTYSSTGLYIVTLTVQDSKGGSGSAQTTAQINNPMPLLLSINPASIAAGSPDFTLTLNGDNFITTSTVIFNNQQYSSNYINKTQIEATIPASAVATPGDYLAKVINPSPGGGETSPLTFTVKPAFEIAITSPSDGETINKAKIIVRGTVKSDTKDLGITVNGLIAEISGNNWVASNIPLTSGTNLIKAVAKDSNGNTATKTITIYTNEITQFLELSANVRSGIPPLEVYFSVSTSGFTPVSFQMDFEGDGIIDYNGTTFDNISYTYTNEGMFYPKVMVSDNQGNTYSDTIVITVLSKTELDDLLKGKWEGMKQSLLSNDINGALNHFIEESKELYNDIFNALQTQLPQIIQEMQDIQLMYAKSGVAKYRIRKNELCGGQLFNITYYIYFIVDRDGIWRIYKF